MKTRLIPLAAAAILVSVVPVVQPASSVRAAEDTKPMKHMHHAAIDAQIANAKTREDHAALAAHFTAEATRLEQEATQHEKMAKVYSGAGGGKRPTESIVQHCRNIAKNLRAAATESRELAKFHDEIAKSVN
jgi:hypothetical protein